MRLVLLRHAKSSWDDIGQDDRERPLSRRGHLAAALMASFMVQERFRPDLALISPALRARQTWSYCSKLFSDDIAARTLEDIYDFGDGPALFRAVTAHGGKAECLMVVGHNPSIEGLAGMLVEPKDKTAYRRMMRKFPTAGVAVIDIEAKDWRKIKPASGILQVFMRPKDLV